jgi:integrase
VGEPPATTGGPLDLVTIDNGRLSIARPDALVELAARAREYVEDSRAPHTRRGYRADWHRFEAWCCEHGVSSLPAFPATLVLYLTDHAATHRTSTLRRWLAAIGQAHRAAGHEDPVRSPTVRALWKGIRRRRRTAQVGKAPVLIPALRRMVDGLPDTLRGHRDRALVLLGFAGAFRRSELVALDVEDLVEIPEGLVVTMRRSKTDQEGQGRPVGIPYGSNPTTCPVRAVRRWREAAGILAGPLFRAVNRHGRLQPGRLTDQVVALVVKRLVCAAGLDPAAFAGHSLRAGLATSAAAAGVGEHDIMRQTGHRSVTVLRRYIRDGNLFRNNAAAAVGL